ncbi:unnamed protein product [Ostreobium quekettii]|uniref:Fe2OG dioxygenase domain-containing protein n=1 Tax=Ostreobium quekettii TaxID=121088 RepID=A0A8S1J5B3_9CHLO|nr:unnamed protein product [Ostreobium quekettii]|eukprot:evm.model.scf_1550.1 EVM.evm.TU.scf_1550.1   scf_1550:1765-3601(+)
MHGGVSLGKRLRGRWLELRRLAGRSTRLKLAAIGTAAALLCWLIYLNTHVVYTSCREDQPLAVVRGGFMPDKAFEEIRSAAAGDPLALRNELNEDNFKYTRGWVVKFNREGLARVRGNDSWAYAVRYFDAVENPEANAFVMNLLVAEQPPAGEGDAVGPHFDDTVAIFSEKELLAHQVNVLYVGVPEDIEGGQLEVWPYQYTDRETYKTVIQPRENSMVEFRGDACHRVRNFQSPSGQARMSLVVEQYIVPPGLYASTAEFCFANECWV